MQRLLDAGAIALGVTNTSELTLWIESSNRLYGRTSNPYDPARTAGGSSGGEGAAVGSGGSPFGLASDIGGSIRDPGPVLRRVRTQAVGRPGPQHRHVSAEQRARTAACWASGPLARRAEDLIAVLRVIAGPDGEDPAAREMEIGDPASVSLDGLRVMLTEETSRRPMSPELHDARERAAGALAAAGARLRRVSLPSWRGALLPFLATLQAGADQSTTALLAEAGAERVGWRRLLTPGGPHTLPTRLALLPELLPQADGDAPDSGGCWPARGRSRPSCARRSATACCCIRPTPGSRRDTGGRSGGRGC